MTKTDKKSINVLWKNDEKKMVQNYASRLGLSFNQFVKSVMVEVIAEEQNNASRRKK